MISSGAYVSNSTWPFYTFPRFEQFGYNTLFQSKTEVMNIFHRVREENLEEWLAFSNSSYKAWFDEGYEIESRREGAQVYDNFNGIGYHPYITRAGADGFVPEEHKHTHWVSWSYSPPPFTYGFTNWDFSSVPDYDNLIKASIQLKNETLFTQVRFYVSADIAFTKGEHAALHSPVLKTVTTQLPHSILFQPIHKIPDDDDSEVVAFIAGGSAWDASMLDLLPDGVNGLYVVVRNNCNQSYTFVINGPEAVYLGDSDSHDPKYNAFEKVVNLDLHTNGKFASVQGHCVYRLVSQ